MPSPNEQLVRALEETGVLHTPAVIRACLRVDRADFAPTELTAFAYRDVPLPIGFGQTISQPTTVAFMLELLAPRPGDQVLDVGSGSGWTTALLAELVGPTGRVWGVERVPELVLLGQEQLAAYHYPQAAIQVAGAELGLPEAAPFDRILVSAAANKLPAALVAQLRPGGVLVLPVLDAVWRVEKQLDQTLEIQKYGGFSFVPLIEG